MPVRGRTGLFGSGKTLGMVQEAYHVRERHPDVPVMTNLSRLALPGAPVFLLNELGTEAEIMDALVAFKNGYLLLDEVGVYLPSRRWNKMADVLMAKWQQMRKDGVEMRWTCIRPSQVVKDIRDITFETAWCESWRRLGFFTENWYSYTMVQDKKFFLYRNISLLRGKRMRAAYDSMGKVGSFLNAGADVRPVGEGGALAEPLPLDNLLAFRPGGSHQPWLDDSLLADEDSTPLVKPASARGFFDVIPSGRVKGSR